MTDERNCTVLCLIHVTFNVYSNCIIYINLLQEPVSLYTNDTLFCFFYSYRLSCLTFNLKINRRKLNFFIVLCMTFLTYNIAECKPICIQRDVLKREFELLQNLKKEVTI